MIYAVIDTNVLVSALLTSNDESATVGVLNAVLDGRITPLYHRDILIEYEDVLSRPKFNLSEDNIERLLGMIIKYGIEVFPKPSGENFVDLDDLIFYEVAYEKKDDGSFLVTGNKKHFPVKDFIVSPSEMIKILDDIQL